MLYVFHITLLKHPLLTLVIYLAELVELLIGIKIVSTTRLLTKNNPNQNILSDR
jgi:hypothetical protein